MVTSSGVIRTNRVQVETKPTAKKPISADATPVRTWSRQQIESLLSQSDNALIRGLFAIYAFQTNDEKAMSATLTSNGAGFNGVDAPILTSMVEFYKSNGYLSPKQKKLVRQRIMKYSGQLVEIANNKAFGIEVRRD